MDQELKELVFAIMDKTANTNLSKVSIQNGNFSVTVENGALTSSAEVTDAPKTSPTQEEENGTTVYAPLVGTFYAAGAPDQKPFVSIGDRVSKGQTLCIIEAMKTMNTIESPCDGIVRRLLVQNGALVEYHQPLIVLE